MEGEGEYTCFTNFDDLDNVRTRPEYNTGTRLRLFDQETKQFRSGLVGGGAHGYLQAIPGFKSGSMRNVKPSGDYNAYEKSRRENKGLPALQGGSNLYYHLYGQTNDTLGLGYGTWNSNDGVTAANTGTRLDFNGPGSPRFAALKEIDSTGFDTIKIHALLGDNDIVNTYRDSEHLGGTLRDKRVQIYYWAGDKDDYVRHPSASTTYQGHNNTYESGDGWRPNNLKPNGLLLANFFGGLMIYFDRPFKIGEFIKSPDRNIEGIVEKIGWRLTVVRTFSKNVLYIPNTAFSSIIVENATRMSNRRINETIGIRYDDLSKMKSIIDDVNTILSKNKKIDQSQKAKVYFKSFSASSCDFFIYAFTVTKLSLIHI